jgi:predicted helicase
LSAERSRAPQRRSRPRPGSLAYLLRHLDRRPERRGAQFEQVCRWYLLTVHAKELKNVWLWNEWPDKPGADCGIDIVAETFTDELWAIQCKAVAPNHAIRKREIDSFLAEANQERFARRLLIATTDLIGSNAKRVIRAQANPVEVIGRSQLGASGVSWPPHPEELAAPTPVASFALKKHQREALDAISHALADGGRGQVVMACGTGKTLVAIKARERLRARRTIVFVPSLALIKQTIAEWLRHSERPFNLIAVCSDRSVDPAVDLPADFAGDLGVRVTTDGDELHTFCEATPDQVVFATYQSSPTVVSACGLGTTFDLAIADEAHWTAGAVDSPYAAVLHHDAIRADRRIFMTATPRRLSPRLRREAGSENVASMDDPALYGNELHRLSFGEAIRQQLLADYRVVVCLVEDRERLALAERRALVHSGEGPAETADDLAAKVLVARALRKWHIRRLLTFHARVERARAFSERLSAVAELLDEAERPRNRIWTRHIHGQMSSQRRRTLLSTFANLPPGECGVVWRGPCELLDRLSPSDV